MSVTCGNASPDAVKPGKVTVYWPAPVLATVGVLPRRLIAAVRCPSASTWTPPTETPAAMSEALLPSTWSAFRPVATPVAFVVNDVAFAGELEREARGQVRRAQAGGRARRRAARRAAAAVDRAAAGLGAGLRVRLARHVAALGARRRIELADDFGLFARRAVAHFGADRVARGHCRGLGAHLVIRRCAR